MPDSTRFCVAAPGYTMPIAYASSFDQANQACANFDKDYPGSYPIESEAFWQIQRAATLATFPLTRITEPCHAFQQTTCKNR